MKTDIHEAPLYSLILLFVIMVIGGGLYIYPQKISGMGNIATPAGLKQEDMNLDSNADAKKTQADTMPTLNGESTGTTSVNVPTGSIELN